MQAHFARREPLLPPRLPRSPALQDAFSALGIVPCAPDTQPGVHRAHAAAHVPPKLAGGGSPGATAQICMVCTSQLRSERPPLSSRKVRLCPTATITCSGCAIAQRRKCPTRSCRKHASGQACA